MEDAAVVEIVEFVFGIDPAERGRLDYLAG
jgi:hypothetical protein